MKNTEYIRLKEIVLEVLKGGPGSGFFGHAGRPGEIGGSSTTFAPDKYGDSGGTSGSKSSEQMRYDKAKARLDKIERDIDENNGKAPFEGEIVGGNVQMSAVGQWRHSQRGEAWNRRDDTLRREWADAKEELDAAKFAMDKAQAKTAAGGKYLHKLNTALSWTQTASIPPGMSYDGYKRAYNAARKVGEDLSNYPTPDSMKKNLGL